MVKEQLRELSNSYLDNIENLHLAESDKNPQVPQEVIHQEDQDLLIKRML